MDQQAATLLTTLRRTSASSESKLTLLNSLKSDIKHHRVPDNAQPIIFDCLKVAISQQSSSTLATAGLTTLSHLIKRLKIQDADGAAILQHAPKLYPALHERLGDLRESHRSAASQCLTDLWPFCGQDVENLIRDDCIAAGSVRAKEAAMQWVVKMNREASLPFKSFVPLMVINLEESDGTVRDAAKAALIDLFKNAPDRAKADLKKQLNMHNVRAGIAAQVLSQIESSVPPEVDFSASTSTRSVPTFDPHFNESINSEAARPPPPEEIPMDPLHLHSQRELENTFQDMLPCFEGRESEENWIPRDKSVTKLRRITKGNSPTDYYAVYMAGIKQLQDGIMKVANSLRTTTSTNGCLLVQELARTLGPALDPMVEIYAQNFIKMSAVTKHIAAQNGMHTVDTLFQYVSINARVMQHIWLAAQDKNVQPRIFAATWLRTVLSRQAGSKTHFEHIGGLDLADKIIKKGLNDPQPKVKESMRAAYWTFAKTWPEKARSIMSTLDPKAQAALEKDHNNPNAPAAPASSVANLRASTTSRAQSRSSVRDAILAAKKKAQTERPSSAMAAPTLTPKVPRSTTSSHLSGRPVSAATPVSSRTMAAPKPKAAVEPASTSNNASARPGSLMSGAARRPIRKPEPPRPATADPYATRRLQMRPETPNRSPLNSPRQDTVASLARSAAARKKMAESESPMASPGKDYASRTVIASPRSTMASPRSMASPRPVSKDGTVNSDDPSLTKEEDFTMVFPTKSRQTSPLVQRHRPVLDKAVSVDSGIAVVADKTDDTASDGRNSPHRSMSEDAPQAPLSSTPDLTASKPDGVSDEGDTTSQDGRAPLFQRQGSPLKSFALPSDDFQIHEDPVNGHADDPVDTPTPSSPESRILNELPVNEAVSSSDMDDPANHLNGENDNTASSEPTLKAEALRSRKLITSGIERIRSRTLDAHGFRKVLELVRGSENGDVFGAESKRFDDMCVALLDYVVESSSEPAMGSGNIKHSHELKRQAIALLRTVFGKQHATYRKWLASGRWHARVLAGTFDARRGVEGLSLLVKDLETLASEVAAKMPQPEDGERAVLSWLESERDDETSRNNVGGEALTTDGVVERSEAKSHARATALALRTLASLIAKDKKGLEKEVSTRVARIAAGCLGSGDAEVRKASVELATELHEVWPVKGATSTTTAASETSDGKNESGEGKSEYWRLLEKSGVQESARNLIVYFIARRAKGV